MSIVSSIQKKVTAALSALYNQPFVEKDFQINLTKPEFEGDYTVVLFSLVKSQFLSQNPRIEQSGTPNCARADQSHFETFLCC